MRKIYLLGLSMFAMFAFSALTAVSASAIEWLANNAAFVGELEVDTLGSEFLLEPLTVSGNALNDIVCSAITLGDVIGGATGTDLTLEVLNLAETEAVGALGGVGLSCTVLTSAGETGDCGANLEFLLFVDELNTWESKLESMAAEPVFLDKLLVKYETFCLDASGFPVEALCEGETSAGLENDIGGGVTAHVTPSAPISSEEIPCLAGIVEFLSSYEGTDLILLITGELSVS